MSPQTAKLNIYCRIPTSEEAPDFYVALSWSDRGNFFHGAIRLQTLNFKYAWQDVAIMESQLDKNAINEAMLYFPEGAWWQWSNMIYALPEHIWNTSIARIRMPYAQDEDTYSLPLID